MQRYSLYIDHQLISTLVRQLENIVGICYRELDQEYQTYELRTSVYEQFVFQITALFNEKYSTKIQEGKMFKDEEIKNLYELTYKLQGIKQDIKQEDQMILKNINKKGRPPKNQQAQQMLVDWIKNKIHCQGKLKFPKNQLDQFYSSVLKGSQRKKIIPIGSYLRMLKKHNLKEVSIITKGGKEKTILDLKDQKYEQDYKKQEQSAIVKDEFIQQSDLDATSELENNLQYYLDESQNSNYFPQPGYLMTTKSESHPNINTRALRSKNNGKTMKVQNVNKNLVDNFFDIQYSMNESESMTPWEKMMDYSAEKLDLIRNDQIYQNSKSFQ